MFGVRGKPHNALWEIIVSFRGQVTGGGERKSTLAMVAKKEPACSVGAQDAKRKGLIAISGSIAGSLIRVLPRIRRLATVEVIVFRLSRFPSGQ